MAKRNPDFDLDPPEQLSDGLNTEADPGETLQTETDPRVNGPVRVETSTEAQQSAPAVQEPLDTRDDEERAYDELNAVVAYWEQELEDARAQSKDGLQREREALVKIQESRADLQKRFPPLTAAQAIKQHLASEQAKRVAAAERAKGFGMAPGPSSQVDAASGRGGRRGWGRSFGERGVVGPDGNLVRLPDGSVAIARQKPQYRRPLYIPPTGQKA